MLVGIFDKSLDNMLEALEQGDSFLIVEANSEFVNSYRKLNDLMMQFLKVIKSTDKLSEFANVVESMSKELAAIETDVKKVSNTYSFEDALEMEKGAEDGDGHAIRTMADAATTLSIYVNGFKDAIISIAEWLETNSKVFSVGKNGIVVQPTLEEKNQGAPLNLVTFSDPSGENILKAIAEEIPEGEDQEGKLKEHFSSIYNSSNATGEAAEKAWRDFVTNIGKIGEGAQKAFSQAEASLTNAKPSDEVATNTKDSSILSTILNSIFGSSKSESVAPEMDKIKNLIVGDNIQTPNQGLWACDFKELQGIIVGLLGMADSANVAAAEALAGVNAQNKEREITPEQQEIVDSIASVESDKGIQKQIAAAHEMSAKKGNLNLDSFREKLSLIYNDNAEDIDKIINLFDDEKKNESIRRWSQLAGIITS